MEEEEQKNEVIESAWTTNLWWRRSAARSLCTAKFSLCKTNLSWHSESINLHSFTCVCLFSVRSNTCSLDDLFATMFPGVLLIRSKAKMDSHITWLGLNYFYSLSHFFHVLVTVRLDPICNQTLQRDATRDISFQHCSGGYNKVMQPSSKLALC